MPVPAPAPWTVVGYSVKDARGLSIANAGNNRAIFGEEALASLRLAAAAPDLLAALQEMLKYAEGFEDADHVIDARAAIARATA